MLKKLILISAIGYTIVLATLSLVRLNNLPDGGISFADKIFHCLAYALLTLFWFAVCAWTLNVRKKSAFVSVIIFAILFGIIIEVLQHTMTDYRELDVYDILANTLGVMLASLILFFKNSFSVKNT
ncbi:VanZ family protein [Algibacter mikhailovii]|mgnify:CR=1 FL=1|uniref:VanZ-like domain-containing protein n=1 Tax=Algibacter mikhailovii TaxID=425498 RepID=A0A918V6E4_9FLAO|nr:VanZ family protein [Algibacter mikhailovii]GGZ74136.1 hypothetical protein GCM10007028_09300 [Algibacter mikhailovii]